MKKIFLIVGFIFLSKALFAAFGDENLINKSSFTKTNDTQVAISSLTMAGGVFDGVVVSSSMGGTVTFFDSVGTGVSTIGVVSMLGSGNGAFYVPFEVRLSSGLTYTTIGNTTGISIIYKVTRPN